MFRVVHVQAVLLGLGLNILAAQLNHLIQHAVQVFTKVPAQPVVAQHLVVQHTGSIRRRRQCTGHQVHLPPVPKALWLAHSALRALRRIGLAHRLGHALILHAIHHGDVGCLGPALGQRVHRALHHGAAHLDGGWVGDGLGALAVEDVGVGISALCGYTSSRAAVKASCVTLGIIAGSVHRRASGGILLIGSQQPNFAVPLPIQAHRSLAAFIGQANTVFARSLWIDRQAAQESL